MNANLTHSGACPLTELGFIAVSGPDAASFLNAQLSRQVPDLGANAAPLAGWHDPQGRVRALFRVLPFDSGWVLAAPADGLMATLTALQRFVLRAQVRMTETGTSWRGAALIGLAAETAPPTLGAAPGSLCVREGLYWVRVGPGLVHVFGPPDAIVALLGRLPPTDPADAVLAEIALGLVAVTPDLAARYLAQMLDLDRLGAVSFDKGCYPGQEVITRTERRGTVKRRLQRFGALGETPVPTGTPVVTGHGDEIGEVVRAAPTDGGYELLAVVRLDALDSPLLAGTQRTPLERLPLPGGRADPAH